MNLIGLANLRFFLTTPLTTLTALLGVALGVASITAVHEIGVAIRTSLPEQARAYLPGMTHFASHPNAGMDEYFDLRGRWRAGEFEDILNMSPVVEGSVVVLDRRVDVVGTDWLALGAGGVVDPQGGSSTHINTVMASSGSGFKPAQTFELSGKQYLVRDVVPGSAPALFADIGTAQGLLNRPADHLSYIAFAQRDVFAAFKHLLERLMPGISRGVPDVTISSFGEPWQTNSLAEDQPELRLGRSVLFNLGALGTLSLVVAWILIYQICVTWLRRQLPVMQRLYAIGVSMQEIRGWFILALIVLGLLATLSGVAIGHGLSSFLLDQAARGMAASAVGVQLSGDVLIKGTFSGIVVFAVAGLFAFDRIWNARVAGRIWPAGIVLLLILVVGSLSSASGLIGGFAAILAACLLTLLALRPMLNGLKRSSWVYAGNLLNRLAVREVIWFQEDLRVALGALVLALATSIGVGLMVDSFRLDFERMLGQRLGYDLYVTSSSNRDLTSLKASVQNLPGVTRSNLYGRFELRDRGQRIEVGHSHFDAVEADRYGYGYALELDQALVSDSFLGLADARVGQTLDLAGRTIQVVGRFPGFGDMQPRVLIHDETAQQMSADLVFDRLSVNTLADKRSEVSTDLARLAEDLSITEQGAMREIALLIFDRTFAITRALTVTALLVAMFGLYNSLTALRLNQQATTSLLNAMGLTRLEKKRIDFFRATAVAFVAILASIPLGVLMAWQLCELINPRAFGWRIDLYLAWYPILLPCGLGLVAALIAGLLPGNDSTIETAALHGEMNT
ncbi:MAG: hypothetical protein O3A63_13395 [Proteobacteria bacterium]|nr:hypothetical protein [Pseudomonadota bacterium]